MFTFFFSISTGADRSFVTFILDPLYKLTGTVIGEHPKTIEKVLGDQFGVVLKSSSYSQDVKPLLKQVRGARTCAAERSLIRSFCVYTPVLSLLQQIAFSWLSGDLSHLLCWQRQLPHYPVSCHLLDTAQLATQHDLQLW